MAVRRKPILGKLYPSSSECLRMIKGGKCGKPAEWHIIWQGKFGSVSCSDCKPYAQQLEHSQIHSLTSACLNIRSLWYPDLETCKIPTNDELSEGIIILGI